MKKQSKQLYSQNKIAGILGISRGTFSKWLKENSVSPKQQKGQRKLYDETVIEQYKQYKKGITSTATSDVSEDKDELTTVQLLHETLQDKQKEIDYLKKQLEDSKAEKERLNKKIDEKDQLIAEQVKATNLLVENTNRVADHVAQLADQAHTLNLADKLQNSEKNSSGNSNKACDDVERDVVQSVSDETADRAAKETVKTPKKHWWQRITNKFD